MNEKKPLPPAPVCCLWRCSICASSQLREMTACALSSSRLDVALISLEMTLSRYDSTGSSLMAQTRSESTTRRSVPRKVCVS